MRELSILMFLACLTPSCAFADEDKKHGVDLIVGGAFVYHTDRNEGKDVATAVFGLEKKFNQSSRFQPYIGSYVITSDSHYCPMVTILGGARFDLTPKIGTYLRAGPAYKCINPQKEYRLQPWAELGLSYTFAKTWNLEAGLVPKADPIGLFYLTKRFTF